MSATPLVEVRLSVTTYSRWTGLYRMSSTKFGKKEQIRDRNSLTPLSNIMPVFMGLPNTQQIFVDILLYLILSISDEKYRQPGRPSYMPSVQHDYHWANFIQNSCLLDNFYPLILTRRRTDGQRYLHERRAVALHQERPKPIPQEFCEHQNVRINALHSVS